MVLNITCPHCGALLDVAPAWLGQPVECGGCGSVFPCPELAEEAPPDDGPPVLSEKESRRKRRNRREQEDRWADYDSYSQDDDPDSHLARQRGPGFATASLILGILSITLGTAFTLVSFSFCGFIQTLLSVIGLLLGYIGLRSESRGNAIAGLVLNALGAIVAVIFMGFVGICLSLNPFGPPAPPPPAPVKTSNPPGNANNPPPAGKNWK